ncbi:hypothetical protein [Chryseobacterium sp. CCH4-E10]|uniref:hypothetical protein n=1 Tax=Chryseobacterium sp. CCH4-E10 TaxID=1768758 RepID=UPI0008311F4C|nr:hypothetical protein [Chryseobacterium sp. CCH4-E10]
MEEMNNNTFGTLSSAPDNTIITTIYNYLSSVLSVFTGRNNENENAITNRLCKSLNSRKPSEYPFYFHHQNIENEKENTSTDFAVFGTYAYAMENDVEDDSPSLIKFEAKRLNSKLPKQREKEYVCGQYLEGKCSKNSGGVERFKNGRHGKDVMNAAIVGYIQTESASHWLQKVNGWIKEQITNSSDTKLIWNDNDVLTLDSQTETYSHYSSLSYRIFGDEIRLKHFWIDISK